MTDNEARLAFLGVGFALLFIITWWFEGQELKKEVVRIE